MSAPPLRLTTLLLVSVPATLNRNARQPVVPWTAPATAFRCSPPTACRRPTTRRSHPRPSPATSHPWPPSWSRRRPSRPQHAQRARGHHERPVTTHRTVVQQHTGALRGDLRARRHRHRDQLQAAPEVVTTPVVDPQQPATRVNTRSVPAVGSIRPASSTGELHHRRPSSRRPHRSRRRHPNHTGALDLRTVLQVQHPVVGQRPGHVERNAGNPLSEDCSNDTVPLFTTDRVLSTNNP